MAAIIGTIIGAMLLDGFGISTNIYGDFLGVSKQANDNISFLLAVIVAIFMLIISFEL